MSEENVIKADRRGSRGTTECRRLRKAGMLPAVIYGRGHDPVLLEVDGHGFAQMLSHHVGESMILDLQVGDEPVRKVLLKEVQHEPVSSKILHVDFHEISMTEKLRVTVPITLIGEPVGVSEEGGQLEHVLFEVEIECLPADVPEQVEMDVSAMKLGDHLTVGDIALDADRYELITGPETAVATVIMPRQEEEEEVEETALEEGAAGAEPEVIGESEEEGEPSEQG